MSLFCCLPCTASSSCTKAPVSVWTKRRFFQKAKSFSRYPSPNLPLKVWGGLFVCASFPISFFKVTVCLHKHSFSHLGKKEILLSAEKFFPIHPSIFPLEEWGGTFLSHMICHSARSANARTHRHYKQKSASRFKQPADFPEKRKKYFTTPLKSPFKEWGVFFKQPKCRVNHSLSA